MRQVDQAAGEALLTPSVTRRLIAHFTGHTTATARTPWAWLSSSTANGGRWRWSPGPSNAELAAALHVTLPMAETHVSRILTRLGARDRTQLVILGYQSGIVTR